MEDRELIQDRGVKISKCGLCCFEGGSWLGLVGYVSPEVPPALSRCDEDLSLADHEASFFYYLYSHGKPRNPGPQVGRAH